MRAFADEMLHRQRKRNSSCREPGRTRRSRQRGTQAGLVTLAAMVILSVVQRGRDVPEAADGTQQERSSRSRSPPLLSPPFGFQGRADLASLTSFRNSPRAVTASACDACARAITSSRVMPFTSEALVTGLPNANAAEARKKPTLVETSFNQVRRCVPNRLEDESRDACLS